MPAYKNLANQTETQIIRLLNNDALDLNLLEKNAYLPKFTRLLEKIKTGSLEEALKAKADLIGYDTGDEKKEGELKKFLREKNAVEDAYEHELRDIIKSINNTLAARFPNELHTVRGKDKSYNHKKAMRSQDADADQVELSLTAYANKADDTQPLNDGVTIEKKPNGTLLIKSKSLEKAIEEGIRRGAKGALKLANLDNPKDLFNALTTANQSFFGLSIDSTMKNGKSFSREVLEKMRTLNKPLMDSIIREYDINQAIGAVKSRLKSAEQKRLREGDNTFFKARVYSELLKTHPNAAKDYLEDYMLSNSKTKTTDLLIAIETDPQVSDEAENRIRDRVYEKNSSLGSRDEEQINYLHELASGKNNQRMTLQESLEAKIKLIDDEAARKAFKKELKEITDPTGADSDTYTAKKLTDELKGTTDEYRNAKPATKKGILTRNMRKNDNMSKKLEGLSAKVNKYTEDKAATKYAELERERDTKHSFEPTTESPIDEELLHDEPEPYDTAFSFEEESLEGPELLENPTAEELSKLFIEIIEDHSELTVLDRHDAISLYQKLYQIEDLEEIKISLGKMAKRNEDSDLGDKINYLLESDFFKKLKINPESLNTFKEDIASTIANKKIDRIDPYFSDQFENALQAEKQSGKTARKAWEMLKGKEPYEIEEQIEYIKELSAESITPLSAINDGDKEELIRSLEWVKEIKLEDPLERLDDYDHGFNY